MPDDVQTARLSKLLRRVYQNAQYRRAVSGHGLGLGKTVITLSAINDLMFDSFTISRVLVIGPKRVISDTWPAEIRKWDHLRNLDYSIAAGTVKQRVSALNASASITLISRDNVKWLVDYYARYNLPWDFDMVVIDELSSFKSDRKSVV